MTSQDAPPEPPSFLFTTCQVGAERALKAELARTSPDFHFAFSRPGFLTFKLPPEHALGDEVQVDSVFARARGFTLGRIATSSADEAAQQVWSLAGSRPFARLHVWQRDRAEAGYRGYEPGITEQADAARATILKHAPAEQEASSTLQESLTTPGDLVLDCVLVQPHEWWVGYHGAADPPGCWPGGIFQIDRDRSVISRAYWKMAEALAWSQLPTQIGDRWAEIGCAPGGSSQALLERGFSVLGVDPADVDPHLATFPDFTHLKKRGADVRRRSFRDVDWLAVDVNVAPSYTLEMAESIATHAAVELRGVLLTLKLLEWSLAEEIPSYLERIRSWGFDRVHARQLSHNRQEICVAAWRSDRVRGRGAPRKPRFGRQP